MKDPWFQIGIMRPIAFSTKESFVEDNIDFNGEDALNVNCNNSNNDNRKMIMVHHCGKSSSITCGRVTGEKKRGS